MSGGIHYKLKDTILPVYGPMSGEYADRENRLPKPRKGPNFQKPKRKRK